jgi:hypothetical protein
VTNQVIPGSTPQTVQCGSCYFLYEYSKGYFFTLKIRNAYREIVMVICLRSPRFSSLTVNLGKPKSLSTPLDVLLTHETERSLQRSRQNRTAVDINHLEHNTFGRNPHIGSMSLMLWESGRDVAVGDDARTSAASMIWRAKFRR